MASLLNKSTLTDIAKMAIASALATAFVVPIVLSLASKFRNG